MTTLDPASIAARDLGLLSLRDALPGQTLHGSDGRKYPLGQRLGEGGQGWVFRATWNGSIDVVAKVLRPDVVTRDALARFHREADVLRRMSQQSAPNPHVVRYYDHAVATLTVPGTQETWTFPFTVLEYVEGETLADTLLRENGAGIGIDRTRHILRHIVLALRDVHAQNIVHRDLKPSNVLIERTHGREIAKVTDFGLAKVFDDTLHRTAALAGATVGYAPPEQFEKGNPRVGKPTDVFSLAAIFFEMLTGEPCFPFNDPLLVLHSLLQGHRPTFAKSVARLPPQLQARPDIVTALDAILSRALATAPDARYANATLFHDAVEDTLGPIGPGRMLHLETRPQAFAPTPISGIPTAAAPLPVVPAPAPERAPYAPHLTPGPRAYPSSPAHVSVAPPQAPGSTPSLVSGEANTMAVGVHDFVAARPQAPASVGPRASLAPSVAYPPSLQWQVLAPSAFARPLKVVALAPDGRTVVGAGPDGLFLWAGHGWTRIDPPRFVAPATLEAAVWFGSHLVLAGASSTLHLRSPDGTYTPISFSVPGLVFHGAYADAYGVLLAGEQITHAGSVGVIATMTLQANGLLALGWAMTRLAAPLRAVTREGGLSIACGDFGTVASLRDGRVAAVQLCPQPLFGITGSGDGDGGVIVVGGGGFVFRVTPQLEARLETVQTTKSLTTVTRGVDGTLYCGGEERRVLRFEQVPPMQGGGTQPGGPRPPSWVRAGATVGAMGSGAMVRALAGGRAGVTAFCDDGSILEGRG